MYICDISLNSSYNVEYFRQRFRKNHNMRFFYVQWLFPANGVIYEIMCKNVVWAEQATHDNIKWRLSFACWVTKARIQTHTHREYFILNESLGVSSVMCILELSRLTRVERAVKNPTIFVIYKVLVYTNASADYMFRPLLVRPSSGWIP